MLTVFLDVLVPLCDEFPMKVLTVPNVTDPVLSNYFRWEELQVYLRAKYQESYSERLLRQYKQRTSLFEKNNIL